MSLKSHYKTLELYRYTDGNFGTPSGYSFVGNIKGIIQVPSNRNNFVNGKDSSSVDGVLFTDVSTKIQEKDKIKQPNGKSYIISGAGSQPNGVTGIKSHHVEYNLEFDNDS